MSIYAEHPKMQWHLRQLGKNNLTGYYRLSPAQKQRIRRHFHRHAAACERLGVGVERGYLLELIGDVRKGLM